MTENCKVVVPEHIETRETDRRGRFTLGSDYADERVTVAVIESEGQSDWCGHDDCPKCQGYDHGPFESGNGG